MANTCSLVLLLDGVQNCFTSIRLFVHVSKIFFINTRARFIQLRSCFVFKGSQFNYTVTLSTCPIYVGLLLWAWCHNHFFKLRHQKFNCDGESPQQQAHINWTCGQNRVSISWGEDPTIPQGQIFYFYLTKILSSAVSVTGWFQFDMM